MTRSAILPLLLLGLLPAVPRGPALAAGGGHPFVPGEVIVKFTRPAGARDMAALRAGIGGRRIRSLGPRTELYRLKGLRVKDAVAKYRGDPHVEYIEPNYIVTASGVPNDYYFPQLHALQNTGQLGGTPGADIHAVPAWDVFTGSSGVLIGVIDSGVDYLHPDLAANMWTNPGEIPGNGKDDDGNGYVDDVHGYDFRNHDGDPMDDNGHGTHIAGTIGAVGNNVQGVVGVNWTVRIMALKFLDASGSGTTAGAIEALNYAVKMGARITNNSWGGAPFSQALLDAIDAAGAAGDLFVASAGGGGADNDLDPEYPASYASASIVAVCGTDADDNLAGFSAYGATSVDLAAPGADILSTYPGASYSFYSGTSMATAHVTGVVGLVWGRFSALGPLEVKDRVLETVDVLPALAGKCLTGGRVNAYAALTALPLVTAAATDVEPDKLNPGAKGGWVTVYLELPEGIDPSGVALETVRLNDAVPAVVARCRLEDWNHNKVPDWTFKFERGSVAGVLPEGDSVPVTVTGEIPETARFTGTDVIRVSEEAVTGTGRSEVAGAGATAARLPQEMRLHAASPNPFHGATRIRFDLPEASAVRLRVFDLRGRMVRDLADTAYPAGTHTVTWDGRDAIGERAASGVYFCRLEAGGRVRIVRMVVGQ